MNSKTLFNNCYFSCVAILSSTRKPKSKFFNELITYLDILWRERINYEEGFENILDIIISSFDGKTIDDFTRDQWQSLCCVFELLRDSTCYNNELVLEITRIFLKSKFNFLEEVL